MPDFDLVVHPDFVIPVVPNRQVLKAHSVGIQAGRISTILPTSEARTLDSSEHIELTGHVLLPGLINLHSHSGMSLLRGYVDSFPLMTQLQRYIWPTESHFVSPEFVKDGADLAIAQLLMSGTTTLTDQYFFPEVTAAAIDRAGLRALLTFPIIDLPTAWARNSDECLEHGLSLRDNYRDHDLIEVGFGPHSTYMVSEEALSRVTMLAEELEAIIHIPLHETQDEVLNSVERVGERPIDKLERLGALGPRTHCVHMTALGAQDIDTIAMHGAHVIHCPRSNLLQGSSICPVQRLLDCGINVALGADGAASSSRSNMLLELQTASLVGKTQHADSKAVDVWTTLEMATIRGAHAIGLETEIGSIETGKLADLIALDLSSFWFEPQYDIASLVVHASRGNEISWSWVAGRALVKDGILQTIDHTDLSARTRKWSSLLTTFRKTLEH